MPRRPKNSPNDDFSSVVNDIVNANSEVDLAASHPSQAQTTAAELLDPKFTYLCKIEKFLIGGPETERLAQLTTDAINGKIMIMTERWIDTKDGDSYCVLKYLVVTPKLTPARSPGAF